MELWVGNVGPIRGYLVRKVGQKESALSLRQLQSTVLGAKSRHWFRVERICGKQRYGDVNDFVLLFHPPTQSDVYCICH